MNDHTNSAGNATPAHEAADAAEVASAGVTDVSLPKLDGAVLPITKYSTVLLDHEEVPYATPDTILAALRIVCKLNGGQKQFALKAGVSPALVSQTIRGQVQIGAAIANGLGYFQTTIYVPKNGHGSSITAAHLLRRLRDACMRFGTMREFALKHKVSLPLLSKTLAASDSPNVDKRPVGAAIANAMGFVARSVFIPIKKEP